MPQKAWGLLTRPRACPPPSRMDELETDKTPSEDKPRLPDRQVHSLGAVPTPAASVGEAVFAQPRATPGAQSRRGASLRPGARAGSGHAGEAWAVNMQR